MKKQKKPKYWNELDQFDKNWVKEQEKMNRMAMALFPDDASIDKVIEKMFKSRVKTVGDFIGKKKIAKIDADVEKEFK